MSTGRDEFEVASEVDAAFESDAALMGLAGEDPDAFGRLFDRHAPFLLAWAFRRTGDAEVAADLTMETFAAAYLSRRRFDPAYGSARPWLLGIAKRQLARLARRRRLSTKHRGRLGIATTMALPIDEIERIEHLADFAPTRDAIREALAELPDRQARAVWLRVGMDMSYEDVAAELGCTVGAARVRVTRGLSRLMERLDYA